MNGTDRYVSGLQGTFFSADSGGGHTGQNSMLKMMLNPSVLGKGISPWVT